MDVEKCESVYSDEILLEFEAAREKLLPDKSRDVYVKEYDKFVEWRRAKNVKNLTNNCDEKVVMAYLSQMSKVYKPSSLWCIYSKLKKMLKVKENIDISQFFMVTEFMKNNSVGDVPKKSWVLQRNEIQEFMLKAPDVTYLLIKVVTAFGIFGACRREELHELRIQDVTTEGSVLLVKIRRTKTYTPRQFTIVPVDGPVDYVALYNKYAALRPKHVKTDSLFLSYHNGKCSSQVVGKNTFGKMPMKIAEFLKLPNANKYTGHCFQRSAATILAESGGDTRTLKQLGGWRSDKAESYVENSLQNKIRIAQNICAGSSGDTRSSKELSGWQSDEVAVQNSPQNKITIGQNICGEGALINIPQTNEGPVNLGVGSCGVTISNPSNCIFNFYKK